MAIQQTTPWTFTNGGRMKLVDRTFTAGAGYKVALFQSTSNIGPTSTVYTSLTNQVAQANGYTTGGISVTTALSGTTTVTLSASPSMIWTASGGSIAARTAVLYQVSDGSIVAYSTFMDATGTTPTDMVVTDGNTFTLNPADGVYDLN